MEKKRLVMEREEDPGIWRAEPKEEEEGDPWAASSTPSPPSYTA